MSKEINKSSCVKVKLPYREGLDTITKARYNDKIKVINGKDPYEMEKSDWSSDMSEWPDVTYPDIVNYLVYTQSAYSLAELKAYKSLQAYSYFVCGFVQDIGHSKVNGMSVFLGKVKHSQRMSEASLKPWLIIENDGSITSGHCTCMAGIGEVCSHVGALLFAIEAAVKIKNSKTVTEEKAYWMLPNAVNKVEYKRIRDIDFTSAKTKKRKLDQAIADASPVTEPKQRKLPNVQPPTSDDLSKFFNNLSRTGTKPAVLSLVPRYAAAYRPKALDKKYPLVLSELYNEESAALQKQQLITKCTDIYDTIMVSKEESDNCEKATRAQSNNKQWFSFRTGRITASRVKRVCKTSLDNPSKSLIKDICYPISKTFTSKQTKWGCDHEKDAKIQYIKQMSRQHENFQLHDCGLIISSSYPYLGATPDGKATCDCCDTPVLIEIKCPFCQRNEDITESVDCLHMQNDSLCLKKDHAYYYQVQMQLFVSGLTKCDFLLWTTKDFFQQTIFIDNLFCLEVTQHCQEFFKKIILPELVGKLYSRPMIEQQSVNDNTNARQENQLIICTCRKVYNEQTDDVIGCDNENCVYVWFHFKCAGIKRVPKGQWFCKECKKRNK